MFNQFGDSPHLVFIAVVKSLSNMKLVWVLVMITFRKVMLYFSA